VTAADSSSTAPRVLLIEDEAGLRLTLSDRLASEGYVVESVGDGETGLEQATRGAFDLILLDVMLPRMNGFDVCREARQRGVTTPILMLTARGQVVDKVVGLKLGADDYLTKPFEFRELLARLRALSRRQSEFRPAKIVVADLEVDTISQTVRRAGQPIDLTAKEYSLIEFLAMNKGKVVGREEISEHVWDDTFDPFSNLIEVYIKRLRKKLDENFGLQLIHTRRGVGYILDDV
jgi:two-component system copper resistance phosphate regulon response regulator CusR